MSSEAILEGKTKEGSRSRLRSRVRSRVRSDQHQVDSNLCGAENFVRSVATESEVNLFELFRKLPSVQGVRRRQKAGRERRGRRRQQTARKSKLPIRKSRHASKYASVGTLKPKKSLIPCLFRTFAVSVSVWGEGREEKERDLSTKSRWSWQFAIVT